MFTIMLNICIFFHFCIQFNLLSIFDVGCYHLIIIGFRSSKWIMPNLSHQSRKWIFYRWRNSLLLSVVVWRSIFAACNNWSIWSPWSLIHQTTYRSIFTSLVRTSNMTRYIEWEILVLKNCLIFNTNKTFSKIT